MAGKNLEQAVEKGRIIPAEIARVEIKVVNSRFIATAGPAFSVAAARNFIQNIRDEYRDASHNVPAYVIGHAASLITHCSDDREPSGTAGRPVLAVLQGSGIGDVVLVVTRYFGGTRLGTGGLVRAYSDATRRVLQELKLAKKVNCHAATLVVPYALYERTKLLLVKRQALIQNEEFAVDVTFTFDIAVSGYADFLSDVQMLTNGKVVPDIVRANHDTIVPLS